MIDHDLRTLGMDLPSVISGAQSAAVALWLIQQLGEGSALAAAMAGGPEHRPWTTQTVLTAGVFNALAAGNWQRSGGRCAKPKPIVPPKRKQQVAGAKQPGAAPRGLAARRLGRRTAVRGAQAQRALPPGTDSSDG